MPVVFKVKNDKFVEVTREHDPADEYSGEATRTTHSVQSISLTNDKYFDVSGAFNESDMLGNVFLVYAIYSTGDSFSSHDGAGIEYIECFLTKEKAMELIKTINVQNKIYYAGAKEKEEKNNYFNHLKDIGIIQKLEDEQKELGKKFNVNKFKALLEHRLYYNDEAGNVKLIANPWYGYFDRLDNAECLELPGVEVVNIRKKKLK